MPVRWIAWACFLIVVRTRNGAFTEERASIDKSTTAAKNGKPSSTEKREASAIGPESQDQQTMAMLKDIIKGIYEAPLVSKGEQQSSPPSESSSKLNIPDQENEKLEVPSNTEGSTIGDTRDVAKYISASPLPGSGSSSPLLAQSFEPILSGKTNVQTVSDRRDAGTETPQSAKALPMEENSDNPFDEEAAQLPLDSVFTSYEIAQKAAILSRGKSESATAKSLKSIFSEDKGDRRTNTLSPGKSIETESLSFESIVFGDKSDQRANIQSRTKSETTTLVSVKSVFSGKKNRQKINIPSPRVSGTTTVPYQPVFAGDSNGKKPTAPNESISKAGRASSFDSILSGDGDSRKQVPGNKDSKAETILPLESTFFDSGDRTTVPSQTTSDLHSSSLSLTSSRQPSSTTPRPDVSSGSLMPIDKSPSAAAAELLSVVIRLRSAGILPPGELSLTVCGHVDSLHRPLAAWPDTSRVHVCDNCTRMFMADLLRGQAASVHVLLVGDGCTFQPPSTQMEEWTRNAVLLLGAELPCVELMAKTMFQRVPDAICLERTGQLRRAVFGRAGLITLGFWSTQEGLQLVDMRTARRANGHLMTEGTEIRVVYTHLPTGLSRCMPSATNSTICSHIVYQSPLKMHAKVMTEFGETDFYRYHNITWLYLNPRNIKISSRFRRLPMTKADKQAIQMLVDGKADLSWPYRFVPGASLLRLPVTIVDSKSLRGVSFLTVKRYQLVMTVLIELFSWRVWVCVLVALALFGLVVPPMVPRIDAMHGFTESLAMLMGQSSTAFQRIRVAYRSFGVIWVFMGMILTTAYLSNLIGQLTMPKINYPRNAKELVEQGYRMTSVGKFQRKLYMSSGSQYNRQLGRSLIVQSFKKTRSQMVSQKLGIGSDLRALMSQAIRLVNETDGLLTMDDLHFSEDNLLSISIGRIFAKNHPLAEEYSKFILNAATRGHILSGRVLTEARSVTEAIKRRACRRKSPGCERRFRVEPLDLARVQGPLMILALGLAVSLLALLVEVVMARVARCCRPLPDTMSDPVEELVSGASDMSG